MVQCSEWAVGMATDISTWLDCEIMKSDPTMMLWSAVMVEGLWNEQNSTGYSILVNFILQYTSFHYVLFRIIVQIEELLTYTTVKNCLMSTSKIVRSHVNVGCMYCGVI